MRRLSPLIVLLAVLAIAPLGARPLASPAIAAPVDPPELSQPSPPPLPPYVEQESQGGASNGTLQGAELISPVETSNWTRTITGTIGSSTDLDYYRLRIYGPGAKIKLTLSGPPADYDLVLASGSITATAAFGDGFRSGLEDIAQVGGSISAIGGSISAIGGSISAIGGSISAIGGSISAIGGSISAIGGSISAISVNPGTASEMIDTMLWLPGDYYIAVTTSNGEFSATPYSLEVEVRESGLGAPPPVPEVDASRLPFPVSSPSTITTIYVYNSDRLTKLYPDDGALVDEIGTYLNTLAQIISGINNAPPEYGIVIDLSELQPINSGTRTINDIYDLWDDNRDNPLYANYVAGLIDNVIESVITGQPSGPDPQYNLGFGSPVGPLSNVRNVVLVGGDEVIPFFRLPDLTEIANEAEYADYLRSVNSNGIIGSDTALGAALRYRMLLSDSPYGSDRPYRFYGFPFFVPHLAVGRLVETSEDLAAFLGHYAFSIGSAAFTIDATAYSGPTPPRRAFVSGYDFLRDQADRIGEILRETGLTSDEITLLNNDQWQRSQLEQAWFDGALDVNLPLPPDQISGRTNIGLSSVNAHFDHWQLLPAANPSSTSAGNFPARRLLQPRYSEPSDPLYFSRTLGYSVGCHSGYNVPASAVLLSGAYDPDVYRADFPQAFNRHGGNWVGNTGYGYGTADGIDYSERLAVLYTEELARSVFEPGNEVEIGATIGEALVRAKQRYVRNAASLSAYDYKAVSVMTLYGLPYVRVLVTDPLDPPAEDPAPGRDAPLEVGAPKPPSSLGRLTRTITFTINVDPNDFKSISRTNSRVWDLDADDFTVVDEFDQLGDDVFRQQVRVFHNNQVGTPMLPTFAYDISARNNDDSDRLRVVDVTFVSGTYGDLGSFNPQVTQVATETLESTPLISRGDEPSFAAGAGLWFPDKFFGFSSVGEGDDQRDQLTAFAAQFRADSGGATGTLRPYTQMVFRVTYDDPSVSSPAANALDQDTQAPLIESVTVQMPGGAIGLAQANQAVIVVKASDTGPVAGGAPGATNQGLSEVSALYMRDGTSWQPITLTETQPGVYRSSPLPLKPGALRFIVRATDRAGNSSYYTAKGQFTPTHTAWLPTVAR